MQVRIILSVGLKGYNTKSDNFYEISGHLNGACEFRVLLKNYCMKGNSLMNTIEKFDRYYELSTLSNILNAPISSTTLEIIYEIYSLEICKRTLKERII